MIERKKINVLPAGLRNQIAAGEVVERPSSVVKELVENAVDAGSTRIDVNIERGGQGLISVRDDGFGIPKDELRLAVTRHATSKISNVNDLSAITSFGFRGEALPSIASVSRFRISSNSSGEAEAWSLHVEGSEIIDESPAVLAHGTAVEVRDLFYNIPARLKFLKTESTEARRCNQILFRISLANPHIGFSFVSNGKEQFNLPHGQSLADRLGTFWSSKQCESLLDVGFEAGGIKVKGLAGIPSVTQSRSDRILMYVNGRPVQDKLMISAVRSAYKGRLISREYPLAVIFLDVSPELVDVNVHPAKMEVRFRDEKQVFSAIRGSISQALSRYEMGILDSPETGEGDEDIQIIGNSSDSQKKVKQEQQDLPLQPREKFSTYKEFRDTDFSAEPVYENDTVNDFQPNHDKFAENYDSEVKNSGVDQEKSRTLDANSGIESQYSLRQDSLPYNISSRESAGGNSHQQNTFSENSDSDRIESVQSGLTESVTGALRIPGTGMDYLGQVANTYLVLRMANGALGLLDQHAAHERIIYANMHRQRTTGDYRPLAVPFEIALHPSEAERLQDIWEELLSAGFRLETSVNSVSIKGIPPTLEPGAAKEYLRAAVGGEARTLDDLWVMLSCKSAIKAGQPLANDEAMALLETWVKCPEKEYCPHGRPVFVSFSVLDMEKLFKRK